MTASDTAPGPLAEELIPCPDPWDVARKLAHLPGLLFLDSADRHPERGRYSYVAALPDRNFRDYDSPTPSPDPLFAPGHLSRDSRRVRTLPGLPPFQGGYAGLIGYEFGRQFERLPPPARDEFALPTLDLRIYRWVVSFDHVEGRAWLVSAGTPASSVDDCRRRAENDLRFVREALSGPDRPYRPQESGPGSVLPPHRLVPQHPLPGYSGVTSNFSPTDYRSAVRRAVDYCHAGDIFQVNLSQRLLAPLTEHPLDLYGRLRHRNPAPYGCYFDGGDFQILSASPEQFLQVRGRAVVTRPIKGTRPRGRTHEADTANLRELLASEKDRAENVMIVDLLRNDIGRVCEYGSVTVPKVCEPESFRFVHHLVSEVHGRLRPGRTAFDLLRAAFPGGSVTGAPKVRAMEIISELEPTARGPYCGSIGFIGFDGSMDTNILIRTFTAGRGWLQFPVGGGVVADSDPDREYDETLHKAAGLLRALDR